MLSYFKPFGWKCVVLNNRKDDLGKFNIRSNKGVLVDIPPPARFSGCTTKEYNLWKKMFMLYLMKLVI